MEDIKNQLVNRLKEANNVLVAVTNSPTIDQLAAAISLTLILNKLNKHATTVFSGDIPPVIEFLKPEKTIEKNTDSLRDFIISLDKGKADKLRYKIEDQYVKIFITPYHTSINEKDLVFSQGDFNVDVVIGLGVQQREELDQAITSHGRILHDATVATITTDPPSTLGSINLADKPSSSLCEIIVGLLPLITKEAILDDQIATALLTGIVSETQRFSNQKTTSSTMTVSSKLLAAGANQQLVAQELTPKEEPKPVEVPKEEPVPPLIPQPLPPVPEEPKPVEPPKDDSGTLQVDHSLPEDEENDEDRLTQVLIDEQGTLKTLDEDKPEEPQSTPLPPVAEQPPTLPIAEQPPAGPKPENQSDSNHSLMSDTTIPSLEKVDKQGGDMSKQDDDDFAALAANLPEINSAPASQSNSDHDVNALSSAEPFGGSSKLVIQPPPQPHLRGVEFTDPSQPQPQPQPGGADLSAAQASVSAAFANGPNNSLPTADQALTATPVDLNLNHEPPAPPLPPPIISPPTI